MRASDTEKKLLGLFMVLSPAQQRQVLCAVPSEELFEISAAEAVARTGLSRGAAEKMAAFRDWDAVSLLLEKMHQADIRMISFLDRRYPYDSPDAAETLPPILFVKGDLSKWVRRGVAVVGTRRPDAYGRKVAYAVGAEAAARNIPLISGMALGVDGESHRGALENGGFTVAVMGCGLLHIYPPSHRELFERICVSGVAVSQFLPSQEPDARYFPSRNQWIAYFSDSVVIVEGELNSGARYTAEAALKHSRNLYAVPGHIDNPLAALPNRLLSEGAKLLSDASIPFGGGIPAQSDLFSGITAGKRTEEKVSLSPSFDVNSLGLSELALAVYEKIGAGEAGADELHRAISASLPDLNQALLELELAEIIRQEAGRRYRRV